MEEKKKHKTVLVKVLFFFFFLQTGTQNTHFQFLECKATADKPKWGERHHTSQTPSPTPAPTPLLSNK